MGASIVRWVCGGCATGVRATGVGTILRALDPKPLLMVVVIATALRSASTTEKCAVPPSSGSVAPALLYGPPYSCAGRVAASEWLAASARLKGAESMASSTCNRR